MSRRSTTVVKLNVGGSEFVTTFATLSAENGSRLANLIREKLTPTTLRRTPSDSTTAPDDVSKAPTIFVDRDGTHFRHILNYLRDGASAALPTNVDALRELAAEAKFYKLDGLLSMVQRLIDENANCFREKGCRSQKLSTVSNPMREDRRPTVRIKDTKLIRDLTHKSNVGSQKPVSKLNIGSEPFGHSLDITPIDESGSSLTTPETPSSLLSRTISAPPANIDWKPAPGDFVHWRADGWQAIWADIQNTISTKGYVDWIACKSCENDYELRLPEVPEVIFGWKSVYDFIFDMRGKVDNFVNETCVYVTWRGIYCAKDGYLDSVRFVCHVPMSAIEPS